MRTGDAFLMHLPGSVADPYYHLFIVLTDPEPGTEQIVAVMLSTVRRTTDDTVVLQAGEHPFIKHPTAVQFSTANYYKAKRIERAYVSGICHERERITAVVLDKIRAGLLASPYTVNAIRDYCRTKF
ncbi:MAG: hypothetical protein Q8O74_04250 [bacterium]|nr:hypothetical protein [bacterium]